MAQLNPQKPGTVTVSGNVPTNVPGMNVNVTTNLDLLGPPKPNPLATGGATKPPVTTTPPQTTTTTPTNPLTNPTNPPADKTKAINNLFGFGAKK